MIVLLCMIFVVISAAETTMANSANNLDSETDADTALIAVALALVLILQVVSLQFLVYTKYLKAQYEGQSGRKPGSVWS
jgi:hypothetical protein